MTDKEFVLSVYPGAEAREYGRTPTGRWRWRIFNPDSATQPFLDLTTTVTVDKAWASAAKRIREQQKEQGNG